MRGGFDLGFERAGMECVGQVEINPFCRKVLAKHWPNIWRHDDVKTVTKELCDEYCGRIDLICGGFPCQDVSGASVRRAGINGDKSGLWKEMFRIVCEIRPKFLVVENVAGLLIPDKTGFAPISRVLGDLAEIGYDAEWDFFPVGFFGSCHLRKRVFVVAYPNSFRIKRQGDSPNAVFFGSRFESCNQAISKYWVEKWTIDQFREGEIKPLLRGEDNGLPEWLDEVSPPGNAVCPQVAEFVGRLIIQGE